MSGLDRPTRLSHRQVQVVFFGLMLGMLLPAMNATIVATALPAVAADLGTLSQTSWIVTSYLVAATVSVPLAGQASDLFGRRGMFLVAIVVFTIGSVVSGVATDMATMIVGRVVQGVAGGALMALAQTTIGDVVSPRERGRYTGYIGAVFTLASLAGPLVGGVLVDRTSWRFVFFVNVPVGLLALAVTHVSLRIAAPTRRPRVDLLGGAVVTVVVTCLLLASILGGQRYTWSSPVIVSLLAVAAVGLAVVIPLEWRHEAPVLPLRLFGDHTIGLGMFLSFLLGAALFGATMYAPTFVQIVNGLSATSSGFVLLAFMCGMLATNVAVGRRIARTGRYRRYPVVGTAQLVVGFGVLAVAGPGTPIVVMVVALAVIGSGVGLCMQVITLAVQNAAPYRSLGAATSSVQLFRMLGGTLGVAGFGAAMMARIQSWAATETARGRLPGDVDVDRVATDQAALDQLSGATRELLRHGVADAMNLAYALLIPVFVLAFVAALFIREIPLRTRIDDEPETTPKVLPAVGTGATDAAGGQPTGSCASDRGRPDP